MTREILTPHGPFSFIALTKPKVAIGGISAYGEKLHTRFGFIISVAKEFYEQNSPVTVKTRTGSFAVHYAKLDDTTDDIGKQLPEIMRAVALVKNAREAGHDVLVTCAQGRNRSALVAAEALIQSGVSATSVVKAIKERRANALTNRTFVEWLMRRR